MKTLTYKFHINLRQQFVPELNNYGIFKNEIVMLYTKYEDGLHMITDT
jgi:hypothetical protein